MDSGLQISDNSHVMTKVGNWKFCIYSIHIASYSMLLCPTEIPTKMKLRMYTYMEVLTITALSSVFTFLVTSSIYIIVYACIYVYCRRKMRVNIEAQQHDALYEDVAVIHRSCETQRFHICENVAYGPSKISSTST